MPANAAPKATHRFPFLALLPSVAASLSSTTIAAADRAIDSQRDVFPILSDNCFNCHGQDEASRKGGLRLDVRESALRGGKSGDPAIVPAQPDRSPLLARITTDDEGEVMPPPKTKKKLTPHQIQTLKSW